MCYNRSRMKDLEKSLKALANKRRLAIVKYLKSRNGASVSKIAAEIKISIKATSKHLAVLSNANILEKEQKSLYMVYTLTNTPRPEVKNILSLL